MDDASNGGRSYGYAELMALLGGNPTALPEPYRIADTGITFDPDPAAWATLTDDERLTVMPEGWRPGLPVLAFPCSASEIRRFIDATMIPALMRWREQDKDDATSFEGLSMHPVARDLAVFLADGPHPHPGSEAVNRAMNRVARPVRRDVMGVLIARAQAEAGNPSDPTEVFGILQGWARERPPRSPLIGLTDVGLQWLDERDEPRELSRRDLGRRIRLQRSGVGADRKSWATGYMVATRPARNEKARRIRAG